VERGGNESVVRRGRGALDGERRDMGVLIVCGQLMPGEVRGRRERGRGLRVARGRAKKERPPWVAACARPASCSRRQPAAGLGAPSGDGA
jgi:hypothetical protein